MSNGASQTIGDVHSLELFQIRYYASSIDKNLLHFQWRLVSIIPYYAYRGLGQLSNGSRSSFDNACLW